MKKNYTLKLVLAILVVVLVSLVSFVGVYKGKNLLKEYSLGRDFSLRKVASFNVKEEETTAENQPADNGEDNSQETENSEGDGSEQTENTDGEGSEQTENADGEGSEQTENNPDDNASADTSEENPEQSDGTDGAETTDSNQSNTENTNEQNSEEKVELTPEQIKKNYVKAKDNIAKRLTAMKSEEYDIRLDEGTGKLVIEVPSDINSAYLSQIVAKGNVKIKNTSSSEVIVDSNAFKDASARLDSSTYSSPVVIISMKLSNDAVKKLSQANTKYTDSEGNESDATFAVILDDDDSNPLYSETASTFVEYARTGKLDLVMGQSDEGEELENDYQTALAITAIIRCGEIPVEYEIESIELVSPSIDIKTVVIVASIIGAIMFVFAVFKFKTKAILPVISLVGLVATILLVLRYTNVKITLFTVLGLATVTIINYIIIWRTLNNQKSFKYNFIRAINVLVPCIIIAVVFCCAPYLQLASFGMTIFWGLIVMCIYNAIITRVFIGK